MFGDTSMAPGRPCELGQPEILWVPKDTGPEHPECSRLPERNRSTRSNSDTNQSDSCEERRSALTTKAAVIGKAMKYKKEADPPTDSPKITYKVKYKTELCKNFQLQGYCSFGDKCCYAHGHGELRSKTHLNANYKSKICKHYHGQGACPYGHRCQYVHIKDSGVYSEFLVTLTEYIFIREQEAGQESIDLVQVINSSTKLAPRMPIFQSLAADAEVDEIPSILEIYRKNNF